MCSGYSGDNFAEANALECRAARDGRLDCEQVRDTARTTDRADKAAIDAQFSCPYKTTQLVPEQADKRMQDDICLLRFGVGVYLDLHGTGAAALITLEGGALAWWRSFPFLPGSQPSRSQPPGSRSRPLQQLRRCSWTLGKVFRPVDCTSVASVLPELISKATLRILHRRGTKFNNKLGLMLVFFGVCVCVRCETIPSNPHPVCEILQGGSKSGCITSNTIPSVPQWCVVLSRHLTI